MAKTDLDRLSYQDVKKHAITYLLELEKQGKVTRGDGYQGILNAIAADVRTKHWKRIQRRQELDSMADALKHLRERKKHFTEQIESYHNYVEASMATMQRGKGCALPLRCRIAICLTQVAQEKAVRHALHQAVLPYAEYPEDREGAAVRVVPLQRSGPLRQGDITFHRPNVTATVRQDRRGHLVG